jgi:hypothetical protein
MAGADRVWGSSAILISKSIVGASAENMLLYTLPMLALHRTDRRLSFYENTTLF